MRREQTRQWIQLVCRRPLTGRQSTCFRAAETTWIGSWSVSVGCAWRRDASMSVLARGVSLSLARPLPVQRLVLWQCRRILQKKLSRPRQQHWCRSSALETPFSAHGCDVFVCVCCRLRYHCRFHCFVVWSPQRELVRELVRGPVLVSVLMLVLELVRVVPALLCPR